MLEKYTSKLDDARKKAIERGLAEATGAPSPSAAVSGVVRPAGGFPSAAISAAAASPVRASSARISASSLVAQAASKGVGKPAAARGVSSASTASKTAKPGSGSTASAGGKKATPGAAGGKGSGMARPKLCFSLVASPIPSHWRILIYSGSSNCNLPVLLVAKLLHSARCRRRVRGSVQGCTAVPPHGVVRGGGRQGAFERRLEGA